MFKELAAVLACGAIFSARAGAYTDLWSHPEQPGWGANVVQQGEQAFVTLFLHGEDGRPTWLVASDARVVAISNPGGFPVFRGSLYRTRGPFHGAPYNPGDVHVAPVGTMALEVLARDRLRLHYAVDGVSVTRELRRQSVAPIEPAFHYAAQFVLRASRTDGTPLGAVHYPAQLLAQFDQGEGYIRVDDHRGRRCEYRGTYRQSGKLLRFSGGYTCTGGESPAGSFDFEDLEVSDHGMTGRLTMQGGEVVQRGRFGAARL